VKFRRREVEEEVVRQGWRQSGRCRDKDEAEREAERVERARVWSVRAVES
jgi:hypothetical protein